MSKLLIIGIDGMDSKLVTKYIDCLPNIKSIIDTSPEIKSESVFPPDSDTAWASIYTGLNPAKHGIVEFVDPLERSKINKSQTEYINVEAIKGKTFWDIAGKNGKKICLIYPHLAYPVWKVNGFMINPNPDTEILEMYPPDFKFNFPLQSLEIHKRIPRTKLEFKKYLDKKRKIVINEFDFGQKMLSNHEFDLFFLYSSVLDSIMHIFWNYCDPEDPTYPGENLFKDAIRNFYILYDELIGKMLNNIDSNTSVLILSDHGHSMRPTNLFNINEVLRQEGYLFAKEDNFAPLRSTSEKIKRIAVNTAQRSGLRPAAMTFLRLFPKVKNMYTTPSTIDFEKTKAHCTDLSGMKAYTYGGIIVRNIENSEDISKIKENISAILSKWTIPGTDEKVVEWIIDRKDLYPGPFSGRYPDLIFNLRHNYGAGWSINESVFSKSSSHKFFPGSHCGETPVFYMINCKKPSRANISLMDIAPTVLDLLEIDSKNFKMDGESIL